VSWNKNLEQNNNITLHIEDNEPDENIFSKFKTITKEKEPIVNLNELKEEMKVLHSKLDKIMDLLTTYKQ
jgi:hypothetical protein